MSEQHVPIITLDGPSGTGKGTISLMLARHLNWNYLDSGAIYRVLSYAASKEGIDIDNLSGLVELARSLDVSFDIDENNQVRVFYNDNNITKDIRTEQCGQNASKVAEKPEVRKALLERQREFASQPGLVTDGRDMGTIVFPDASLKIYLDASTEERASRRYKQLKEEDQNVTLAQVVKELISRDKRDTTRAHSPLKPANDAIIIDTTKLDIKQTFNNVLQLTQQKFGLVAE
jgi:cytidylate kinase